MTEQVYETLERFIEQEKMWSWEMSRGVENLDEVIRAIGYDDVENFLLDNPGAIEALISWIGEQRVEEWSDRLEDRLEEEEEVEE